MLYVHMAVLLNELFFPKYDPHTASLLSAFAFCSTFVFRPIGALIFGYLGDNIGRKSTVIITTMMMAMSCVVMANLPTYEQIGIAAAWIITICRITQGMTCMGEIVGAEIYITEITKPPAQYPAVMLIAIFSILGGTAALAVASLVTSFGINWRIAFWIGAGTALVGTIARNALRETPDFADAKRQLTKTFVKEKIAKKTMLALLLIQCGWPVCFYFVYIHCGNLLKTQFNYTSEEVIHQNLIVSIISLLGYLVLLYLSYKVHPLKILKVKVLVFIPAIIICAYLLNYITNPFYLFLIQSFFILFILSTNPATPVFYTHIPIFKRFTFISLTYAISRALMHVTTSFGLVYLVKFLGSAGLLVIMLPVSIGYAFGVLHFEKLETEAGNRPKGLSATDNADSKIAQYSSTYSTN
eukprot:gnl/Spiro4/26461_TR13162_c0_g1_i1.p2 gnl/Spiro4/26461_TR13162_c0_g1~~gnl/Spiro4/26461_TR13162_c0_g1_i1.p2  ORF type:complete len:412 (+),score=-105.69 gnl/Spiro4/26461_TR13162_c0_g1_i1:2927-4162(+)